MVEKKEDRKADIKGIIEGEVRVGKEKWRIIGIYMKGNIEEYLRIMEKWIKEKKEEDKVIIGGDFNARTGRGGAKKKRERL